MGTHTSDTCRDGDVTAPATITATNAGSSSKIVVTAISIYYATGDGDVAASTYSFFAFAVAAADAGSILPPLAVISPRIDECGAKAVPFGITHMSAPLNGAAK